MFIFLTTLFYQIQRLKHFWELESNLIVFEIKEIKGNNKITELRTILQRESQNS
jgi:hypothetical protein